MGKIRQTPMVHRNHLDLRQINHAQNYIAVNPWTLNLLTKMVEVQKNNAENSAGLFKANNNGGGGNNNGTDPNKKIGSKLWQSARKCTEVIQRKLKKSPSTHFEQQNQQQQLDLAGTTAAGAAVNVGHGSVSSPSTKPIQANA